MRSVIIYTEWAILHIRGPRFILHGISWKTFYGKFSLEIPWKIFHGIPHGQKHEKLRGDSVGFHVEYTMELPCKTSSSTVTPWSINLGSLICRIATAM